MDQNNAQPVVLFAALIGSMLLPSAGYALEVCGNIKYFDTMQDRSYSQGVVRESDKNTNRPAILLTVYVMDMDGSCIDNAENGILCGEIDDDILGSAQTDYFGNFCVDYIGNYNDIYLMTKYESELGFMVIGEDAGIGLGVPFIDTSRTVHYDVINNININWNITCTDDSKNNIVGECDSLSDVNNFFPKQEDLANSVVTLALMHSQMPTPSLYYERNGKTNDVEVQLAKCPGAGWAPHVDYFCVDDDNASENHIHAHEMGHIVHARAVNDSGGIQVSQGVQNNCGPFDFSLAAYQDPSTSTIYDNEKCLSEAWANFFAGAMFFYPYETNAYYRDSTKHFEGDISLYNFGPELCTHMSHSLRHTSRGNMTRFLWDVYDWTNTSATGDYLDDSSLSLIETIDVWDRFVHGILDRQNFESGHSGANIYDYRHNASLLGFNDLYGEAVNNCVDAQDF